MRVINPTAAQSRVIHKIAAGEFRLLMPHQRKDGLILGSGVRIYSLRFEMLDGFVKHDVLDTIMLLDVDFFVNYFGERTHLFAWGVHGKNYPFIYIVQDSVIKGWQSFECDPGVNDRGLWMPR